MLKLRLTEYQEAYGEPAAFGRLCVETGLYFVGRPIGRQPPSGGCVLKHIKLCLVAPLPAQPPSGGCVLKPNVADNTAYTVTQPPSGGCVLKLS